MKKSVLLGFDVTRTTYPVGAEVKTDNHTCFYSIVMMRMKVYVIRCVSGFPEYIKKGVGVGIMDFYV